ncbi:PREDICTED: proteoglycan 4-like isoform X2 [Ipomoea nil]|uniref:proteoglycan 4-like isoform X2 n=1 Tax=Ipomoea nil TaxID=35883 RepID=UPI000901EF24|nr:PREDICTED: proteoglycan 4-like isoform X2 [Ipomoea nil]
MVDYIEFRVFPSQNRYEACICYHNKIETVASGVLEPLAMQSPKIKALCSRGSDETFKLQPPENLDDAKWFTRSALMRFVHIISSSEVQDKVKAMENEISQLEESLKFHASIYEKADDTYVAPDSSKNELLRAMELRLTTLRGELESAWYQAAGSSEEITAILKFCHHFGALDLSNSLQKVLGLSQEDMPANVADVKDSVPETGPTQSETPVIYGASPAKAAQIERQSSSEGEESSCISEEDQPSVERSRPLTRSASPRRSASPMRRIQIGRSGTRRSTALTIKSLSYFPASREKLAFQEKSDEEESEQASRMSVQDRISLFEGKQKAQTEKTKSVVLNAAPVMAANKAVLRRWSSGIMGDSNSSDNPPSIESGQEILRVLPPDSCTSGLPPEKPDMEEDDLPVPREEGNEMEAALTERTCQNDEEVSPPQIAITNTQPAESEGLNDGKDTSFPSEQAVRPSNHHYNQKRNEQKLRGETDRKQVERKNPRSNLDEGIAGNSKKTQRTLKNSPQSANPKTETSKPSVVKKVSSAKASPLPATRKSWPSTPSPRATGASQVKTPSPRAIPATRRSKPTPSVPQSSQKLERSQQPHPTSVKASPSDTRKSVKSLISQQTKTKVKANEVTKKSSMAPLKPNEPAKKPRPFLHKDSRTGAKAKNSPPLDPLRDSVDSGRAKENEMASVVYEQVHQQEDTNLETETQLNSPQKHEETGSSNPVTSNNEVDFQSSAVKDESEDEPNISPEAWTKIEEHEDEQIPSNTTASQSESLPTEPESAAIPHPESDVAWGNEENPPTMVYQKDAPKGLKKLLKFARKSKTDANTTRLSSQSVIEETIALSKKDGDKKATSHTKNYGNKNALSSESRVSAQATKGKLVSQTKSQKLPEGTKAFKGTKQNDPLVH